MLKALDANFVTKMGWAMGGRLRTEDGRRKTEDGRRRTEDSEVGKDACDRISRTRRSGGP